LAALDLQPARARRLKKSIIRIDWHPIRLYLNWIVKWNWLRETGQRKPLLGTDPSGPMPRRQGIGVAGAAER
jgi:hypothetical protein